MLHLKRLARIYEARLTAYEAFCGDAAKYEAPLARCEAKPFQASFTIFAEGKNGGGKLNSSETISYAQVGCTDCKGTRTFDFFGKHL